MYCTTNILKFCAIYSVFPSSVEFNPLLFTALRMMGDLYNQWGQAEIYLTEALDITESAYLTRHVEAALSDL